MCYDCSSYSGHSGNCPVCRRAEFVAEHEENHKKIVGRIALAVLCAVAAVILGIVATPVLFVLLIGSVVFAVDAYPKINRNRYLKGEILKIESALSNGQAQI
jgi:hypothetical protein